MFPLLTRSSVLKRSGLALTCAVACTVPATLVQAETPGVPASVVVTPTAQVRQRLVVDSARDFASRTGAAHRRYVTQRARAGVRAEHNSGVRLQVTLQDVRAWGEEADPTSFSAAGIGIYEGYGQVDLPSGMTLTLGRQGLSWDDERLIGKLDWAQRARAFDAVRLDGHHDQLQWQVFGAWLTTDNAQAEADAHAATIATGTEKVLTAGRMTWQPNPEWKLTGVYLFRWAEALKEKRHTAGGHLAGKLADGQLALTAEGYGQFGQLGGKDLLAWMGAARLRAEGKSKYKPAGWVWGEALSGDRKPTGAFDTLYGTNHRYYGEMDLFLDIPKHTKLHGLVDAGAGVGALVATGLTAGAELHWFTSMRPDLATDSSALGEEVDVKLTWAVKKGLWLQALYGVFAPGEAIRALRVPATTGTLALEQMLFVTVDATL